jgi:hypothetical protein
MGEAYNDLDLLRIPDKKLKLSGREIVYKEMSAGKSLKAVEMYQKTISIITAEVVNGKTDNQILSNSKRMIKYQDGIIDCCLYILTPEFSLGTFFTWMKYRFLKRSWLYKNTTVKQLEQFIKIVMEPILGEDAVRKMQTAEAIIKG